MMNVIMLIAVCLAYALLAFFVLANNPKATINRVFGVLMVLVPLWSISVFLEDTALPHVAVGVLIRFDFALSSAMMGLFFWFCSLLGHQRHWSILNIAILAMGSLSVILSLLGWVSEASWQGGNLVLVPQPSFAVFVLFLALSLIGGLAIIFWKFTTSKGVERVQLTYVSLGMLLSVVILVLADVIAPRVFDVSSPEITRLGLFGTLFFAGFSAYAVIRHRFMDIRLLVVRSLAYALLLVTIAVAYALAAFVIGNLVFSDPSTNVARAIYNLTIALVLAFTFQPLRRFFERLTNHLFYRNNYEPQVVINNFSKLLVSELNLDNLLANSIRRICEALHLQSGTIVVFDNNQIYRQSNYGPKIKQLPDADSLAMLKGSITVTDELNNGSAARQLLDRLNVDITLELRTKEGLIGYLLLGGKLSGSMYSTQDVGLLGIVAKELAVAVSNAKAYAEIQSFNRTLQDKVNEATSSLRVANTHLRRLDEAKDEFISMASHQLRTPLTSVKGYISMVLDGDAGKLTEPQEKLLQEAFSSAQRMVYLIGDFLNVSRLQTGKFVLEPKPTNLAEIVSDEIAQMAGTAARRGIVINYDKPVNFPTLMLDDNKMRQVIMNFIDNAIFYSKSSGVVDITLINTGREIRLEVHDNGIGVPETDRHKLFTKFFRAENARRVRPDGTGIGLFMAKKVVAAHGGSVIFSSRENHGSTFGFSLPLKNQSQQLVE